MKKKSRTKISYYIRKHENPRKKFLSYEKSVDGCRFYFWNEIAGWARENSDIKEISVVSRDGGKNKYSILINGRTSDRLLQIVRELVDNQGEILSQQTTINSEGIVPSYHDAERTDINNSVPSNGIGIKGMILDEDDDSAFPEGRERFDLHRRRERNGDLPIKVKKKRFNDVGTLACDVCDADFAEIYGDFGKGFIEAHHKIPVSQLNEESETKMTDIALVCSNCHRMLHRGSGLTVEDLKTIVHLNRRKS